jgi:hypothetical protein
MPTKAFAAHTPVGQTAKKMKATRTKAKLQQAKRDKVPKAHKKKHEPKPALWAHEIFENERRPAVIEAIRATGEKVTSAEIDRRLAALWNAEADMAKYSALAGKDRERYVDEKATFDWEGGVAAPAVKNYTARSRPRAASFEDAAQTPLAHSIASSHGASASAAAASVYSYAGAFLQPFLVSVNGSWVDSKVARRQRTRWAALQLMAAGRGPLRALTCNHTLRVASGGTVPGQVLLRRAFLLLGPEELQELHELRSPHATNTGTCEFIQSMLEQEAAGSRGKRAKAPGDVPVSTALAWLRVMRAENVVFPVALLQQCAATVTELECYRLNSYILPRCPLLESLTLHGWWRPPAAWLGLSQLHTLRGVSLSQVPAATIAAVLPRLHTLHLKHAETQVEFPVAAFYDELLPRLRSFGLDGAWPQMSDGTVIADVPPLPLLEDLNWHGRDMHLPRRLMGARPSTLIISDVGLVEWLKDAETAAADSPCATSPLARVRGLTVKEGRTSIARLLREAPQLRQLTFDVHYWVPWFFSDPFTLVQDRTGLIHPKLRHVAINSNRYSSLDGAVPDGYGVRLRQRYFPRLRQFTLDDEEYPVCEIADYRGIHWLDSTWQTTSAA